MAYRIMNDIFGTLSGIRFESRKQALKMVAKLEVNYPYFAGHLLVIQDR